MTVITTIMAVVVCLISLDGSGMEWKGSQTIIDKCVFSEDDNNGDWYLSFSSLSSLYSSFRPSYIQEGEECCCKIAVTMTTVMTQQ